MRQGRRRQLIDVNEESRVAMSGLTPSTTRWNPACLTMKFPEIHGLLEEQLEDREELLLEQVCPEQRLVDLLDPGQVFLPRGLA